MGQSGDTCTSTGNVYNTDMPQDTHTKKRQEFNRNTTTKKISAYEYSKKKAGYDTLVRKNYRISLLGVK